MCAINARSSASAAALGSGTAVARGPAFAVINAAALGVGAILFFGMCPFTYLRNRPSSNMSSAAASSISWVIPTGISPLR